MLHSAYRSGAIKSIDRTRSLGNSAEVQWLVLKRASAGTYE
jgi:hypothetical protein